MSLSPSATLPSRGQCIQATDNVQHCRCPWFIPPASILLDHNTCGFCGHPIHAHVDYVSMVVNHHPSTQCAAYVQKTPLVQRCTCEAQLCDHVATDNAYRSPEPWAILDYFADSNGYNATSISSSNDPYGPSSMFSPADADSTITFSSDANLMPIPTAPVLSPSPRREFSPSLDARNIPLTSSPIPSPSVSSAPSGTHSGITQTQTYTSDYYFVHPDHFTNTYARQPDGEAMSGSLYHHYDSYVTYNTTPEAGAWSGPLV